MEPEVGSILEGKVTAIMKFGAFVALGNGKSGLVHISEIANTFVNDVHDFLQEGQTVKVKVLSTENGKINLSIKKALPPEPRPAPGVANPGPDLRGQAQAVYDCLRGKNGGPAPRHGRPARPPQKVNAIAAEPTLRRDFLPLRLILLSH